MKNTDLLLFVLFITIYSFGQNEISLELTNASYKQEESKLSLSISIKNNTDSLVYIISPKYYFFDKHLDHRNELNRNGLKSAPFKISITPNKKCKIKNKDYTQVDEEINTIGIFSNIIELKPNETKLFENIQIKRYDGNFCPKRKYKILVTYKPNINLNKNFINKLNEKYDLISKETNDLNKKLYYNLGSYRSAEKDNFKDLKEFLLKVSKMELLNDKFFESNTFIATEIE